MYPGGAFALQNVLVGAVGTLFAHRGPAIAARAMLRLRRHQRRVAAALPLIDAYPAALGGRSELFERLLTNPDPASPYWNGVDLTAATAELAYPRQPGHGLGRHPARPDPRAVPPALRGRRRCPADRRPLEPHLHLRQGLPVCVSPGAVEEFRARLSGQPGWPRRASRCACTSAAAASGATCPDWPPPQARSPASGTSGPDGALGDQPPAQAGSSSFRYDPVRPDPLRREGRSCRAPRAAWTMPGWKHAPTSSRSPARRSPRPWKSSARSAPGCGSAPATRTTTCSPGSATSTRTDAHVNVCDGLIRHQPGDQPGRRDHDHRPDELHRLPVQRRAPDQAPGLRRRAPPLRTQHRRQPTRRPPPPGSSPQTSRSSTTPMRPAHSGCPCRSVSLTVFPAVLV